MLLLIDNYDSFTYNVKHYFEQLGIEVCVKRNDATDIALIAAMQPSHIVISPGPCTPNEAGISLAVIEAFADKIPILGICLGHQCIVQAFGGCIIQAETIMHGKTSDIFHDEQGIFINIPQSFTATRYHSLIADPLMLPRCLQVTAWIENKEQGSIMAIRHKTLPIVGVQFHPEAILSQYGLEIFRNYLTIQ